MTQRAHDNPDLIIARLETVLGQQRDITATMQSMIPRQKALVEAGDAEGLLTLLGDRQSLVDQLIASQDELGESLAAAERVLPGADAARKGRIEEALGTIQSQLAHIMERDRTDQEWLERSKRENRAEIKTMDTRQKAHTAYGKPQRHASRFADHKG